MPASAYQYRPATAQDMPAAHALSVHLKWPHREEDWAMVQRTSEGFVAEHDGRLVGVAFACHQGDYCSIGLVIVSDEHQGNGIGRRLMNLCVGAAAHRTPILNATAAGAPLYASMGFVDFAHIQQHQGVPAVLPTAITQGQMLNRVDHPRLIDLANAGSGLDRTRVITDLLTVAEHAIGLEVDGQLQGMAMLRPFGRGRIIGPVIARHAQQAKALISHLLQSVPDGFVRIDIPAECGLGDWLHSLGLPCVDRAPRMVRGSAPQSRDGFQAFALVTQAIG